MMYIRRRRVATVCTALLTSLLLSACGEDGDDSDAPATQAASTLASEPVNMVIQMSGLLLLVPPKQSGGATHVLMPKMHGHRAYIGISHTNDTTFCAKYNRDICYIDLDQWSVGPVGITSTAQPTKIPGGALNLTRGSGAKVDTTKQEVKNSIRSQVTLLSGGPTDSCGVATWNFDPVGELPPEKIRLLNVLEWQIPNLQSETLRLALHWVGSGSKPDTSVTLRANDAREIELLILHVTKIEADLFTDGSKKRTQLTSVLSTTIPVLPASTSRVEEGLESSHTEENLPERRSQAVRKHFRAFYSLLTQDSTKWRQPTRPTQNQELCPITILDLDDLFLEEPVEFFGIRTYSCIMASAEPV